MTRHWATKYIGLGYEEVGRCWGLVQTVCRDRLGVDMPAVGVGSREDQTRALRSSVRGWAQAISGPCADDIVVMMDTSGRHVGFAVEADGQIGLLHARFSGVWFDPWRELPGLGLHSFEFWRRA